MKKKLILLLIMGMASVALWAQRSTDVLGRGLVAVKVNSGVYCSWRIQADEYYDVKYNLYRDGTKVNAGPLSVSNYTDAAGTAASRYQVQAVVRGVPQPLCAAVDTWANKYLDIPMDHGSLASTYIPNDACCADVDGDGEVEILLKFDNGSDAANGYLPGGYNGEYAIIEVYKLNGKKLWWIDLGPNMGDFQNNENNIVAYDWDGDGKAEAVMRAADGTVIHKADGSAYTIGDASKNYRAAGGQSGQWFIHDGAEYLVYMDGETGQPYQVMEYPLKRLEAGETNLEAAWGDGYGHRSTKHFFGAPYLDGRKPSIFLARGIYTRHKMIALDVDPSTHTLTTRWRWNCSDSKSPWYGNGYHNFGIADVDWDGRDEIVFGSMVIDDNGRGLSTTGLGHGDAQHCGDFDPYTHGQEIYACNEDRPANNYRDATTSKIYYRLAGTGDDGRAMAGNFCNDFPGAMGYSGHDTPISCVTASHVDGLKSSGVTLNFRIYWDGDLQEESFNGTATRNSPGAIYKYGMGNIETLAGSLTNNDTKATPCYQGDIFGDWREEVMMRTEDNNVRIFTTTTATRWRNYSLWYDHQYRQAMVWQMCGYNQPPHTSYFLGELEGITVAPPPLTMTGRTEVADGGTIGADAGDKQIITCAMADMTVTVADGTAPYIYYDNAPTWVQGNDDNNRITTAAYTHTLRGGAFAGGMRLVKQGDGMLVLPAVTQKYTGATDVWAGTLRFDGTMEASRVWLNRHSALISDGGRFKTIQADYNATVNPGGRDVKSSITADSLILNFGSRVAIDLYGDGLSADTIKANVLKIEKKNWAAGPTYSAPVFVFRAHAGGDARLANGKYLIGEAGEIKGDIGHIVIEGLSAHKTALVYEDGKLYLDVQGYDAGNVTWTGNESGNWNTDETANFVDDATAEPAVFVPGDSVTFSDAAVATTVTVVGKVAPAGIMFANNSKTITIQGDSIIGGGGMVKNGTGTVSILNVNRTGNTEVNAGRLMVTSLANEIGQDFGALGDVSKTITVANGATLGITASATTGQTLYVGEGGANLEVSAGISLTMSKGILSKTAAELSKSGAGTLNMGNGNTIGKLIIKAGTVAAAETGGYTSLPKTVEFEGGTLSDPNGEGSYTTNAANFVVGTGKTGTLLCDPRCQYTGTLTGSGTFTVTAAGVRNYFEGDWSAFTGTVVPALQKRGTYDPSFIFNNTYGLPNATLRLNDGVTVTNNGKNMAIGTVAGAGTLAGTGTYTIGANDASFVFSAKSSAPLIKSGSGTMRLLALGNITAPLTVENGQLIFSDASLSTLLNGSNQLTVKGSGHVAGQGLVNSIAVESGAQLTPRGSVYSETPGTLKTNALLNVKAGATVNFLINSSKNSQLMPRLLIFNGTLKVVLLDGYTPAAGDSFTLWNASSSFSGTPSLELPGLPEGLEWDTSALLANEGVLKVVVSTGISSLAAGAGTQYEVYTLTGVKVGTFTIAGGRVAAALGQLGVEAGTYIVRSFSGGKGSVRKIAVK